MLDYARYGAGEIDGMLHNESNARNGAAGGAHAPLGIHMGGLTERPS